MIPRALSTVLSTSLLLGLLACGSSEPMPEPEKKAAAADQLAYFGTYTDRSDSEGIYVSRFNSATGELGAPALAATIENPSYLTLSPDNRFLYAVVETNEGQVSSYSVDGSTGMLTLLNSVSADGAAPCDLETDRTGKMLVVANYSTGSVIAYKINDDGSLTERTSFHELQGSSTHQRQKSPHAHSVDFSADNRFVIVSDLGSDKVRIFEANVETGELTPHSEAATPPGSGPRHFVFHPTERFAYSVNELASTVSTFTYDAAGGELTPVGEPVSTLPDDFDGNNTTAEIMVHPSGKFLYASNRGHHSIAVFQIDPATGALSRVENESTQGETPRGFAIDRTGKYLIAGNQGTHNVFVYQLDLSNGEMTPTGGTIEVGAPVCVLFRPL